MLSYEDAFSKLMSFCHPTTLVEVIPLKEAVDRTLAIEIPAPWDLPRFSASTVDGYAVASDDLLRASPLAPVALRLTQRIRASAVSPLDLVPGQTARIFTGAPLPVGADAVVMQEDIQIQGEDILFVAPISPGSSVFQRGSSALEGQSLLSQGTLLQSGEIGLLASLGRTEVAVFRRPRLRLLACGDELLDPSAGSLGFGQIYESNRALLKPLVEEAGGIADQGLLVPDDLPLLQKALLASLSEADILITLGGASVGEYDLWQTALTQIGATIHLSNVAIRPGKPFFFATHGRTPIFGLPGNPASAWVCFEIFVRPFLRRTLGSASPLRPSLLAHLGSTGEVMRKRLHFVRGQLDFSSAIPTFWPLASQTSGDLLSMRKTHGLGLLPSGASDLPRGSSIRVLLLPLACKES